MSDLDQLLNSMKMKGSGSDKPAAGALAAVPPIPAGLDPDVARILRPMREALLQLPETIRDNEGGGKGGPATSISPDVLVGAGVDPGAIKPSGPPVRPSGFQAQGAMTTIILSWSKQPDNVLAEVWTAAADDMTQAVLVERTASAIYSHSLGTNATRFYWLRFYQGGLAGDWYAQAGLKASTGSIDPVLDQLKGGGITSDMIKALDSAKLVGSLKDWQIEAVNAAKLVGALKDSQIEAIDVNKLKGQIQPQQIAGIDVTKLAGQIESAQIKTLDAIKITGELSEAQVKTVSDGLRSTMAANKAEADRQLATLTDSDKAMAARVDGLSTTVNTDRAAAQAGISEAKTAAADAKQSGAQSIDKLNARLDPKGDIGGAIAGKAEQKALDASLTRLAAVEVVAGGAAKSSDLTALQSTVGNNKATADNQIATLADADKAMATRVDNLTTTVNTDRTTAQAGIKEAKTIASDAKASTAQLFNNLTARLDPRGDIGGAIAGKADQQDLEASLTRLSAVEVAANGTAKSSDLAALQSTVGGNKAAADKQMATLADADKALGLRIDNVTAAANTDRAAAQAGINEAKTAAADAKQSGAQSIDKLTARLDPKGDIGGAIAGKAEQKALDASLTRLAAVEVVAGGAAKSSDLTALQSTVGSNKAAADKQMTTLADADKALGLRVDNVTAAANTDRAAAQAGINEAKIAAADAKQSSAQSINQVNASLNSLSASVTQVQQATATLDGKVSSKWGVILETADAKGNRKVSGLQQFNDGSTSQFIITADQVMIGDFTNLCGNPSGVDGRLDGWVGATPSAISSSGRPMPWSDNNWVMSFSDRDQQYGNWFPVKPGDEFFVSADCIPAGRGEAPYPFLIGLQFAGEGVADAWISGAQAPPASGRQSPAGTLRVPSQFNRARVWTSIQGPHGHNSIWHVWNVQVRRKSTGNLLVDGAITTDKLTAGSVTADKIAANSVLARHVVAEQINTDHLAAGSITAVKIASNVITADKLAASSITTLNLAAGAVTTDKLASNSITTDKLAANSVTAANLAAGAISADKLASKSITADKLAVGSLDAITARIGTLRTATSGARTEISDNVIKVFDENGTLRVRLGNLSL